MTWWWCHCGCMGLRGLGEERGQITRNISGSVFKLSKDSPQCMLDKLGTVLRPYKAVARPIKMGCIQSTTNKYWITWRWGNRHQVGVSSTGDRSRRSLAAFLLPEHVAPDSHHKNMLTCTLLQRIFRTWHSFKGHKSLQPLHHHISISTIIHCSHSLLFYCWCGWLCPILFFFCAWCIKA